MLSSANSRATFWPTSDLVAADDDVRIQPFGGSLDVVSNGVLHLPQADTAKPFCYHYVVAKQNGGDQHAEQYSGEHHLAGLPMQHAHVYGQEQNHQAEFTAMGQHYAATHSGYPRVPGNYYQQIHH